MIAKNNNQNVTNVLECPALKYTTISDDINEFNIMKSITDKLNNLNPLKTKKSSIDIAYSLFMKTILFPIRLLIKALLRSRYFWKQGLSVAYTTKINEIKNEIFDGYRLAAYANEFDVDLLNFVNAQKQGIDDSTIGSPFPSSMVLPGISHMDLILALCKLHTKVIIVHGSDDKVVPIQNSIDIVTSIKQKLNDKDKHYIELRTINRNGHVPHEENANQVIDILNDVIF
jgi:pimeloyl-ACP methyl ester carboxylesterase